MTYGYDLGVDAAMLLRNALAAGRENEPLLPKKEN